VLILGYLHSCILQRSSRHLRHSHTWILAYFNALAGIQGGHIRILAFLHTSASAGTLKAHHTWILQLPGRHPRGAHTWILAFLHTSAITGTPKAHSYLNVCVLAYFNTPAPQGRIILEYLHAVLPGDHPAPLKKIIIFTIPRESRTPHKNYYLQSRSFPQELKTPFAQKLQLVYLHA